MYKDKVNLFKSSKIQTFIVAFCMVFSVVGLFGIVRGGNKYKKDVAFSSSPVGTSLPFARSRSNLMITGLYTDEAQSVLIARLSPSNGAVLPYKGQDYTVYLSSKTLKDYESVQTDILFGRLGVDGDFFLVIPKPIDEIYTVAIQNNKYLADMDAKKSDRDKIIDASTPQSDYGDASVTRSVTSMLSQVRPDLSGEINEQSAKSVKSSTDQQADAIDLIAFRMGLTTAKKDAYHTPIVLEGKLLENNQFKFEQFFNQVFKDEAIKQAKAANQDYKEQKDELQTRLHDYEERLLVEPDSGETIAAKQKVEEKIQQIEDIQTDLLRRLDSYQQLTYTEDFFANLQNKATIIDSEKYQMTETK